MQQPSKFAQFKLPLMILGAFVLAALWVGVGRLIFGVFGWVVFITLFMFSPVIVMYGVVLAIIVAVRQGRYMYRKWGPFMIGLTATLAFLFCVGFFMPDAGDTRESVGSGLSVVLMDRTNDGLIGASGLIAGWSIFATIVASIITFILAFAERPKKSPTATLKGTD